MKILVIDDNKSITNMLEQMLGLEDYEVIVSNSGRNGLTLVENGEFDAILLDLSMPEFSGLDIIDSLEKSGKIKEENIIVMTASIISNDELDGLKKRGVYACFKKPVDPEIIINTLQSISK
jgi:DNA-binding response OmpR family regulator